MMTKLFGLGQQQQQLNDAFQRCVNINNKSTKQELSIIFGSSGSGKTALAQTLQTHAKFLVLGKCDQFQQGSEPLGPFVVAFSKLADEILRKEEGILQSIKSKAQKCMHNETEIQILTDLVPAFTDFFPNTSIKKKNQSKNSSAANAIQQTDRTENPTIQVVCKFLKSICSSDHPIVLIIDDIQWIDSSSLDLLESLSKQQNIAGLMLVATCRDDEITSDHPVSQAIQKLQDNNHMSMTKIHVGTLSVETVSELVVNRFPTLVGHDLEALSTVLHTHTKGNAFFTVQLLHRLEASGWKAPEQGTGGGEEEEWDSTAERSMINHLTHIDCDSLVDIMMSDTADETPFMTEVLTSASCLGSDFTTSHLMLVVTNETTKFIHGALSVMEKRDFIRPRLDGRGWSWVHDKFQKAAYLLISATDRERFHLAIGRRLLSNLDKEELQQHLFIVVSQFCLALKYVGEEEKESVATLLLQAGERSAQSSSFNKAASYFSMGLSLLKKDNWESQYELSLQLYNSLAAVECCNGKFVEADKLVTAVLRHSRSLKDQLQAYETKLQYLNAKDEIRQAIVLGLDVLDRLGERFPRNPGMPKITYEVMSTRWLLAKKSVDDVLRIKPVTDWKKKSILRFEQIIFAPIVRGNPLLTPIFACRAIKLMLKHGLSNLSSYSFAIMSAILSHPLGYLDEGNKCMQICEGIIKKHGVEDFVKARNWYTLHAVCRPFRYPIREILKPMEEVASFGLLTGDIDVVCASYVTGSLTKFFCGERLEIIVPEVDAVMRKWGQNDRMVGLNPLQQLMENLTTTHDPTSDPLTFNGKYMEEQRWKEKANISNDDFRFISFWLLKSFIGVYMGEFGKAKECIHELMRCNLATCHGAAFFQTYFLDALIDILLARSSSSSSNKKRNGRGGGGGKNKATKYKSSLKKLRFYGKDIPSNVQNKINLIEAELNVLQYGKKKSESAMSKFHQSIEGAKKQGLIFEEAFGYERYAIALLEWGDDITQALEYVERAKSLYEQWGSPVKALQLIKFVQEKSGVTVLPKQEQHKNKN